MDGKSVLSDHDCPFLDSLSLYFHSPQTMALSSAIYRPLKDSWLSFVRYELEQLGMPTYLPSSSACFCGKGLVSYPHWRPSTYEEAIQQLHSLLFYPRPHRPSLASCWLSFLFRTQWAQRQVTDAHDDNDDHSRVIQLLRDNCPILSSDQDGLTRRTRPWQQQDCDSLCHIVLRDKSSSYCLCYCPFHREKCPPHRFP